MVLSSNHGNTLLFSVSMSQEEIFRKYMSESAQARKKARNQRNAGSGSMRVIDNEVSMNQIPQGHEDHEYGDEAPQVTHCLVTSLSYNICNILSCSHTHKLQWQHTRYHGNTQVTMVTHTNISSVCSTPSPTKFQ